MNYLFRKQEYSQYLFPLGSVHFTQKTNTGSDLMIPLKQGNLSVYMLNAKQETAG
jgi:hypothetical protein